MNERLGNRTSLFRDFTRRLVKSWSAKLGLYLFLAIVLICFIGPFFCRYGKNDIDITAINAAPSREHLLGCDTLGRDMLVRLLYGGQYSIVLGLVAALFGNFVGLAIGLVAGYFGGRIDNVITRILDVLMAIPALLMAIAVSSALGTGPMKTALAIAISGIPYSARVMRSTVLTIKDNEYIEAAQATGSTNERTIFKHVLPNTIAPLIVSATLDIGGNIMAISGLSFIGLGVQAPTPEWGSILSAGREFLRDFPPIVIFPALFIGLTLFGFNILGDALRDALDPRLKD